MLALSCCRDEAGEESTSKNLAVSPGPKGRRQIHGKHVVAGGGENRRFAADRGGQTRVGVRVAARSLASRSRTCFAACAASYVWTKRGYIARPQEAEAKQSRGLAGSKSNNCGSMCLQAQNGPRPFRACLVLGTFVQNGPRLKYCDWFGESSMNTRPTRSFANQRTTPCRTS